MRVVVTGLGLVTPLGVGMKRSWPRILSGDSGIRSTKELSPSFDNLPSRVAAWVAEAEVAQALENAERGVRELPKYIKYALVAAAEAIRDADLSDSRINRKEIGVSVGSGMAPLGIISDAHSIYLERGPRKVSPHLIPRILPNMAAGHISIAHGFNGPLLSPSSACATGLHAIGDAFRWIKHGYTKVMVAGATEAAIDPLSMTGFSQAKALSTRFNHDPSKASRPWDQGRDGFVMGEGSGVLVLEDLDHALSRGAQIYCEVKGYGCSADANHITAASPNGSGAIEAMDRAIYEAQLHPADIDHINCHATSTPLGDLAEARAIKSLFDNPDLLVTSNKGALGHLLGAAGAVEAILAVLSLYHKEVPPTLNFEKPLVDEEPQMSMTIVTGGSRKLKDIQNVLCNSFGFGGTNSSLCLTRYVQLD